MSPDGVAVGQISARRPYPGVLTRYLSLLALALLLLGCRRAPPSAEAPLGPPSEAARSWYLQAVAAEEAGDIEHASRAWAWVAREDADRAHAHAHHARFLQRQRRWEEADQAWRRALSLEPDWWEPRVGLASLAGRRGDELAERQWLSEAVASGAEGQAFERLIELYERSGSREEAVNTLRSWLEREPESSSERRHRARTAERLGLASLAIHDLRELAQTQDEPTSALRYAHLALQSCQVQEALEWASEVDGPTDVRAAAALMVATRAGDLALMERLIGQAHVLGPPPDGALPVGWRRGWLTDPTVPPEIRLAIGWERAGFSERGAQWRSHIEDTEASAWLQLHDIARARVPHDTVAVARLVVEQREQEVEPFVLALAWHRAELPVGLVAARLGGDTSRQRRFAETLAYIDADVDPMPSASLVEVSGSMAVPREARLGLPIEAYSRWAAIRDEQIVRAALRRGDQATARRTADRWTSRSPADARAWWATALAEPSRARGALDRALELDPCEVDALIQRARVEEGEEARRWYRRALRAAPLDPTLRAEARQAGLRP